MPHIDALLPLYPDAAGRQALLEHALAHVRADLTAMRQAIDTDDYAAARQQVHRAKGTLSFLGHDDSAARYFDLLTSALRMQDSAAIESARVPVEMALLDIEAAMLKRLENLEPFS